MTLPLRAVLFDVGGPIDTEAADEPRIDRQIRDHLAASGIHVTDDQYSAANRRAIERFAWNTYQAIIFDLSGGDPALAGFRSSGRTFELREGMAGLFAWLHGRGLLLGLAANQPARVVEQLDSVGIGHYFRHRQVSGHHGYFKPDVRLFLRACEDLDVAPEETIMVGDRIDNDIVPARILGMHTILFRTGRHIDQQPRSYDEVPHAEVRDVAGLRAALQAAIEQQ